MCYLRVVRTVLQNNHKLNPLLPLFFLHGFPTSHDSQCINTSTDTNAFKNWLLPQRETFHATKSVFSWQHSCTTWLDSFIWAAHPWVHPDLAPFCHIACNENKINCNSSVFFHFTFFQIPHCPIHQPQEICQTNGSGTRKNMVCFEKKSDFVQRFVWIHQLQKKLLTS